jgi:hypothetical protein
MPINWHYFLVYWDMIAALYEVGQALEALQIRDKPLRHETRRSSCSIQKRITILDR